MNIFYYCALFFLAIASRIIKSADFAQIIHLTPPSISEKHIREKITCIRPKHKDSFRICAEIKDDKLIVHNYGHGGAGWTRLFGSVQKMLHEFELKISEAEHLKNRNIRVIGAGCMGLLSAIMLAQKGYSVKIIAEEFENVTSHKAAGIFFPSSMYAVPGQLDRDKQQVIESSLKEYCDIINGEHAFLTPTTARYMPVYVDLQTDYSGLDFWRQPQLVTIDFGNGKKYTAKEYITIFIDVIEMMEQLKKRAHHLGIIMEQGHVDSIADLGESIIINCAGLGAKILNDDAALMPVQGHLISLKEQPVAALEYMVHVKVLQYGKEAWVYFAPKGSGLLGVTFIENEDQLHTNSHEFNLMLERAGDYFGFSQ